jgi:hypothetical protein
VVDVQPGHLDVSDLGIDADDLAVGGREGLDEGQRVADGGQVDVAARLVGLGFERVGHGWCDRPAIVTGEVDRVAHPLERGCGVLGEIDLGAFAASPEDEVLRFELGGGVHRDEDLA